MTDPMSTKMSPEMRERLFGDKPQMVTHLTHALDMVSRLPEIIETPDINDVARVACIEDFFVNVRLLVEFLVRTPKDHPKDFGARDLTPDWTPTKKQAAALNHWWEIACQHVVHFSRARLAPVSASPGDAFDAPPPIVADVRRDVLAVYDAWAKQDGGNQLGSPPVV